MNPNEKNGHPATASLLFMCHDQAEISFILTNFFAQRDIGFLQQQQFSGDGQYFCRLQWQLDEQWDDEQAFIDSFSELASHYSAEYSVRFANRQQSVGLMVSKQSHALIDVLNKHEAGFFPNSEVSFILGNDDSIRSIADRHGTPFFLVETGGDALEYEQRQLEIVHRYSPDYLGLAHYMKVLSANFLQQAGCPVINIQPSIVPIISGQHAFHTAYQRGVKLIGATSHLVTAELNQGPIVEQDVLRVKAGSSLHDMVRLGRDIEQKVFSHALLKALEHKVQVYKSRTLVFS